jgi:hypothetical protein
MEEISSKRAEEIIYENEGKIFTITFIKRSNLELRVMTCRLGVTKYLKGGVLPYDPKEKNLLPVFDMAKNEYRMINLDTLIELKINKQIYIIK